MIEIFYSSSVVEKQDIQAIYFKFSGAFRDIHVQHLYHAESIDVSHNDLEFLRFAEVIAVSFPVDGTGVHNV